MSYDFDESNMNSTNRIIYCQPCKYELPIKDKTLEVLETEFALKYPGPYKIFKEEQGRKMLDFIYIYTKNQEK